MLSCPGKWAWYTSWWRHQMDTFPRYLPFVWGIHRSQRPVTRSLFLWSAPEQTVVNNPDADDVRRHRAHFDITVVSRETEKFLTKDFTCLSCSFIYHLSLLFLAITWFFTSDTRWPVYIFARETKYTTNQYCFIADSFHTLFRPRPFMVPNLSLLSQIRWQVLFVCANMNM